MANIKFSEFTDVISTYSNIFIVGYDSVLNDNIRILSTDVPAIIGAITGSGTPGALPKFITDTSLGDSLISDDGTEVTIAGNINATAFIKVGGTSSQFLKADGSVDSNAYITLADLSASAPLSYDNSTGAFSIAQADSTTDGYLSALDWNTFNQKQAALGGTGIVKSTSGTISYITDNSANWNTAYDNMIVSAAVTGTTTKTLTLNQQDGGTITASWTDENTDAVTSVFGRTGAVVAQSGDYTTTQVTEGTNLYFTNARARAAFSENVTGLDYNSTTGVLSTTAGYGIPTTASQSNWDTAYNDRISTANLPLDITANVISISQSSSTTNGYLSSTDWTTFNSKQAAGNYITSLTGEATGSGPGAASVTLSNSAVIAKVLSGLNITGGTITSSDSILTAFGKVQNQINGLVGGVIYQGTWDASTNTPTLTSSEGTQGYYYIVNVAGSTDLDGITDWNVGDWAIFDGTTWQQVDNTDSVISVNGFTGIVSLTTTNIPEGTNLYYTDARSRAAFSETVTGLDYNSTTGVLSTTSGYGIPTTASQSNWDTAYTERISSLTTTGSSGSATLAANVLNIPTYTLAGLGGVPTSRTLTINGISYDLSANRTWSIDSMVYPSAGIAISTGSSWGTSITDNSTNWNTAYSERISSATAPLSISSNIISISQSGAATNGYLSATDWNTFNSKQPTLSGTGLVKSTAGTISYITDNSGNWDTAYNDSIVSAAVTGTSTKTLTLTQQDGGTVTASWSDADTGLTSVGVSMPSAFTVSNSPLTSNGTIAITGAGTTAQYVRGDGTLATFPTISNEAQRLITEAYNETGATLTKGTVVYINGGHGNLPTITKALANSDATSAQTYGVVQNDITDQNNGFVVVIGSVIDLNTNSYPNGTILYLSPTVAGEWTSTKPYAPQHIVYVGIVTRQHPTQGVVEVRVQNGYEMDELHNVSAQNPNNGDILQFVTSTQLWTKTAGTTTNIAEGTNLYYTDARSRAAFSTTVVGLEYNSTTGVLGIQSGYSIPTNASQTNWNTAYTERISSATAPLSIVGNNISMSAAGISTNGYLTSADWNTFNDKQAAGSYITALTGEATASGPGSVAITLTNNAVTAKVLTGLNITGGTVNATDSIVTAFGKVQNQLNGLVGGTIYKGVWNASTNSPSLSSGVGTQGWYYIVNVAGSTNLDGITDWNIGDWAIFDGTAWQQVDNTDSVTSVNGFTGAVSLTTSNISEGTNLYYTAARFNSAFAAKTTTDLTEGTNLYFTNARAQAAISLTTLGTSGAATYSGGVLNIPQYQAALTDPVTGVGTTNYVAKWTSGSAVGNSSIYDNGTFVGIGSTTALCGKLNITFDSTSADAIILKDTRVTSGSGQWRIGPGSGVIGFGIYSDLLGYSPLAITNSGAATFSSTVTAKGDLFIWGGNAAQSGYIAANSAGGGLYIASSGTNQNIRLVPSGTGFVQVTSALDVSSSVTTGGQILVNTGTANQNTTISGSKVGMSRTSDGAEVVYFSKNTDLGADGTANINGYDGIQFRTQGAETVKLTIAASGVTTITNLAGSGSRMVVADASGVLSTQAIPSGTITGSGTAGYITKWVSGSAVGNSALQEASSYIQSSKRIEADDAGYGLVAFSSAGNRQVVLGVYGGEPTVQGTLLNGTARQLVLNPQGGYVGVAISNPTYPLDVNGDIFGRGNIRIGGSNIFYFETFNGGWYMQDTTWIRSYASKSLWMDTGVIGSDGGLTIGYGGATPPSGGASISGTVKIGTLSGSGSRMVVADASGNLSTQAIPAGSITGSGTAGYITKWTGSNAVGNSIIIESGSGGIGIGMSPSYTLDVNGTARIGTALTINGTSEASTALTIRQSSTLAIALAMTNRNANQTWAFAVDTASVDDKNFGIYNITNASFPFIINATSGAATFSSLAGSGDRMVISNAFGTLSTQAIPSVGSGTTNYVSKWNGTTLTDSLFYSDANVAKTIHSGTDKGLYIDFTNNISKFGVINVNGIKVGISNTQIGDYDFDDTGTILSVDRGTEIIKTSSQGTDKGLFLDYPNNIYALGFTETGDFIGENIVGFGQKAYVFTMGHAWEGANIYIDSTYPNQIIKTRADGGTDKGLYLDFTAYDNSTTYNVPVLDGTYQNFPNALGYFYNNDSVNFLNHNFWSVDGLSSIKFGALTDITTSDGGGYFVITLDKGNWGQINNSELLWNTEEGFLLTNYNNISLRSVAYNNSNECSLNLDGYSSRIQLYANLVNYKVLTTTQINALSATEGDVVYNTTLQTLSFRNGTSWAQVLSSSNYNSYAPTLTGTGASGTWGISISGNAATATSATTAGTSTYASILTTTNQGKTGGTGLTTVSSTTEWSNYPIGYSAMFLSNQVATGAPSATYGYFIKIANRDGAGGWGGIWTDYNFGDTYIGTTTVSSSYASWYKLLSSSNYNSYAPTLTGGGASGTWGISITGNANYATTAGALTSMLISQFTNDSGYITSGALSGYLPLTGGTLSGNLVIQGNASSAITLYKFYSGSPSNVGMTFTDTAGTVTIAFNSNGGRVSSTAWTTTGRNYSNEWIEFPNYSGLYSPNNEAHFYPNNGSSYGAWAISGTRNSYGGISFNGLSNGNVILMVYETSVETGFYNQANGWQFRWTSGTLYVGKGTYGGGTNAVVLDAVNFNSYAATVNHTHDLGRYSLQAPAYIDGLTTTNFRNTLFGLTSNTFNISTARWNTTPTALPGMNSYGTMMAWSGADTQGFIATDYYSPNITVGGGNASNINWSALLLHSSNYSSYALPLSGGTISGDLTVSNKVYIGTNGCYFQEVLIGGVYEIQVVDSAGNMTIIS